MTIDSCGETYPSWGLPQRESNITPREDGIESSVIGTFTVLAKRCSYNVEPIIEAGVVQWNTYCAMK